MQKMLLLATVSTVALIMAGNANSADFPRKAPSMVAATAPYSWTGCYVGAHVGWGWGRHDVNNTTSASGFSGGTITIGASGGLDSSGGLFGGQVGCNYQFAGNWVAGLQGELAGADINGRDDDPLAISTGSSGTIGVKTDWLGSVTGRLGMTAWNNQSLFYVKGGVAWVHNQWDLHDAFVFFSPGQLTETRSGWTVGGGVEWAFLSNWSAFAEFNYYDFGNGTTFTDASSGDTFSTGRQTIETAKIGVNYKFFGGN